MEFATYCHGNDGGEACRVANPAQRCETILLACWWFPLRRSILARDSRRGTRGTRQTRPCRRTTWPMRSMDTCIGYTSRFPWPSTFRWHRTGAILLQVALESCEHRHGPLCAYQFCWTMTGYCPTNEIYQRLLRRRRVDVRSEHLFGLVVRIPGSKRGSIFVEGGSKRGLVLVSICTCCQTVPIETLHSAVRCCCCCVVKAWLWSIHAVRRR
jgi:hypothetical protein